MKGLVSDAVAWYREFPPCEALRADVYAFFSFVPGPVLTVPPRPLLRQRAFFQPTFCSPQFADGHVSLVFELGSTCDASGRWSTDSSGVRGTVLGPMSEVGRTEGSDRPEMIGVYFRPARVTPFLRTAVADLTDKALAIDDLWGSCGARLAGDFAELDDMARIARLESVLLARVAPIRQRSESIDLEKITATVLRRRGRVNVDAIARAAGVSRQHLRRRFIERLGIGPKLYCRLARFHSALAYAGCRTRVDWAQAAVDLGYADQSHMIAELRRFSGLTPQALASRSWFHPFIERARAVTGAH